MAAIQWLFNKVFGQTQIFIIILSWFLVITGLLMLWKPESARRSMAGKGLSIIKGYVLALALFLGALLVSVMSKMSGLLAFVIFIAGSAFLLKGFLFFQKTAANNVNSWVGKVPLKYLRVYAAIQIALGVGMHIARSRMGF
ncbi:MAG: hypothetical protein WCY10_05980 [Candidatus Omnitrophota bacterium]